MGASDNQDQMMFFHQLPPSSDLHHHQKNDHHDHCLINYKTGSSPSSSLENSSSSTIGSESLSSSSSCSNSLDLGDDATSSCSSSSSSSVANLGSHHGSMFELSELMASLPIKRGLSKFYQGKSQSFTSLKRVMSIEDLVKKETPYNNSSYSRRKMLKGSRSYANGLDACKPYTLHKSMVISKKGSFLSRPPVGPCVKNKL